MQKLFTLILLFAISLNIKSASINPSIFKDSTEIVKFTKDNPKNSLALISKLSNKQIETYLGRKLKFKEKLALKILKYKAKQGLQKKDGSKSDKGKTALTLGILALVSLFIFPLATIPLGILAITNGQAAQKTNPDDKNANAGITMGIIALAILAFALIALIAFFRYFPVY
jgi:hypothetical protein